MFYTFKNPPFPSLDQLISLLRYQLIASFISLFLPLVSISHNPVLSEVTGDILVKKFS